MNQEQINFLAHIYNQLMTIEVKGDNILKMANILNELEPFILHNQQKVRKENTNASKIIPTEN